MNPNIYAIISGLLIGLGAVLLKLFLGSPQIQIVVASLSLGLMGGLLLQYSLKYQKMHLVASLSSGSSSIVSAIGGVALLNEVLLFQEVFGVVFVVSGILMLLYRVDSR